MKNLSLVLLLLISLIACENENNIVNVDYSEYISGDSVSSEIDFFPVEMYDKYNEPDTPSLRIRFITTEIFPCMNYNIAYTEFIRDKELIIRFDGIQKYSLCFTANGPAESFVDLSNDITSLVLINGNKIDKYQVDITDKLVEIAPITKTFSNLKYEITFRYPVNSFAFICGTNLNNAHIYDDFVKILVDSTTVVKYEFKGEGRIPYPDSSYGHWKDNASLFFKYENESEFHKAGDLLKNYTRRNISPNNGVGISLTSWNNKKYMSWMMYK